MSCAGLRIPALYYETRGKVEKALQVNFEMYHVYIKKVDKAVKCGGLHTKKSLSF